MVWDFQTLRREWSASVDGFRCKVRWDRRASVARGAAPCTERSDAKQPGHLSVRAVCLAERTYSRQESIEVRPCYQGILYVRYVCCVQLIKLAGAVDIISGQQRFKGAFRQGVK